MQEDFLPIVRAHAARYPQMQPQDYAKLAYQSEYGPEHLVTDEAEAAAAIRAEWQALAGEDDAGSCGARPEGSAGESGKGSSPAGSKGPAGAGGCWAEPIGGGLCRLHLAGPVLPDAPECLAWLFCRSAEHTGTPEGLGRRLETLETLHIPHMAGWLTSYRTRGMPAVHHSPLYRAAYRPHYRVLLAGYARYFAVLLAVYRLCRAGTPALISIDGRCGSGKSSLAALLQRLFGCRVLHTDDFYLPPAQRAPGWETQPGGNMDFERLMREAIRPALAGQPIDYRAYSCQQGRLLPPQRLAPAPLTLLEGSYSQHPALGAPCALRVFLHCAPGEQARRLKAREGEYFEVFQTRWIPLEEGYFARYRIPEQCDMFVDTTGFFPDGFGAGVPAG